MIALVWVLNISILLRARTNVSQPKAALHLTSAKTMTHQGAILDLVVLMSQSHQQGQMKNIQDISFHQVP